MSKRTPIYGLDAVRFSAACLVVIYHLGFRAFGDDPRSQRLFEVSAGLPSWWPATWFGWIGVQIFFVISGLVISYSAVGATGKNFLVGRVARLVPSMLLVTTLCAVIELAAYHGAPARIGYLWLRSNVFWPFQPWIAGQIWTLPIEIVFYAIILISLFLSRIDRLEPIAWLLAVASAAYWIASSGLGVHDPAPRLTQLLPFQHGCYFALGIALSRLDAHRATAPRLALIALCLLTAVPQVRAAAGGEHPGHHIEQLWGITYGVFLLAVAAMVASLLWKQRIAAALGARGGKVLRTLGLITYPLYLLHFHVGGLIGTAALRAGVPVAAAAALGVIASILAAWFIAVQLEPPLQRVIRRILGGGGNRRAPQPVAATLP